MPKVALVCRGRPYSGIYTYTQDLLNGFGPGERPAWVTFDFNPRGEARWSEPLDPFDILHFQYEGGEYQAGERNLFLERLREKPRQTIVATLHEVHRKDPFAYDPDRIRSRFPWLERWRKERYWRRHPRQRCEREMAEAKYGPARLVVHLPSHRGLLLERGVEESRIRVIPHGLPALSRAAARPVPAEGELRLATFGFITEANDYRTVLDALAGFLPRARYTIVGGPRTAGGEGVLAGLRRQIRRRGLAERVTVTGFLPPAEVEARLLEHDVLVAPMAVRSNSGSLGHMLASGRPVVGSDIAYARELREEGAPLRLYAAGSGCDLADRCREAAGTELIPAGKEFILNRSWKNTARHHGRLYQELAEEWILETRQIYV